MDQVSPWQIGLRSARALIAPAALILCAGAALVYGYYRVPAVTGALSHIADWKLRAGWCFAPLTTSLMGGVIPWLLRMAIPALRPARPVGELFFGLVWWGLMGVVIDRFYLGLGTLYDGRGWPVAAVVAAKVLSDMLVFTPAFASPANALSHLWKDQGFDSARLRGAMSAGWYRRLVLPNLVPNFMLWFPGVTLVYAMPSALQLPMSNLIGCFWALMCIQIAANWRGRVRVEPDIGD